MQNAVRKKKLMNKLEKVAENKGILSTFFFLQTSNTQLENDINDNLQSH